MKLTLTIFLFCLAGATASTYSQNTRLDIKLENGNMVELIKQIEAKSEFMFYYQKHELNELNNLSVEVQNGTVMEILDEVTRGTSFDYTVIDRYIVIRKEGKNSGNDITASAEENFTVQQRSVSGKVTDSSNQPLPGVTVVVKGTTQGTITNADGNYTLANIPEDATLVFSFVGMGTQEVLAANQSTINVTMIEETIGIEEVVAIGYGTVKKKDLTGSVSQIAPGAYSAQPVQSVSEMLRGNAAGVTVSTSGEGTTKIRIRGYNSLTGSNDPLYIVDGVPMGSYSPNDVKSIEILKDASATAIYGSRGANGVVLITTKRGQVGNPSVEVISSASFATYPHYYDLLTGPEFADFHNSHFGSNLNFDRTVNTDWQRELTQLGIRQNYQANVSGGTEKMKFYVGGNYINNTGLIKNQDNQAYRLRSNFDFDLGSKFTGRIDLSASQGRSHGSGVTAKGPLLSALQWNPAAPVYDAEGEYTIVDPNGLSGYINPYYETMEGNSNSFSTNVTANGYFEYEIIPGLKVSAQPSVTKSISESRSYTDNILSTSGQSTASRSTGNSTTWQLTGLANYDKTFSDKHNLNLMLGTELWETEYNGFNASGQGIDYNYMLWYNLGMSAIKDISSSYSGAQLASFFARSNYNYNSKYYITLSMRADGSSKFRDENQFSYFPSGALSWVASNEDFLKDTEWLDQLKIRTSYGVTGNQAIGSYATIAALRNRRNWSWASGSRVQGIELQNPVNRNLRWEETTQWDIGIDASVFEKWSISLDYWNKITDGLLTNRILPEYAGGGSTMINLGEMNNQGLDGSVTYTPYTTKDFSWRMTLNGSVLKNKVVDLGEIGEYFVPGGDNNFTGVQLEGSPLIVQEGQSLGQMFGYKWLGLWSTAEAEEAAKYSQKPGDNKYLDKNNNYEYDNDDREVIGNFMPKFTWSYNTTVNWKNFDFNLLIDAAHGADMYNFNRMAAGTVIGMAGTLTLREAAENIWSPSNEGSMWVPFSASAMEKANSSKWVYNADWVKIRNLSVGYTIPTRLLGNHQFRVNASVQNLLTLTGYNGMDPEAAINSGRSTDMVGGVEYGTFPQPRIFTVGLTYKF